MEVGECFGRVVLIANYNKPIVFLGVNAFCGFQIAARSDLAVINAVV